MKFKINNCMRPHNYIILSILTILTACDKETLDFQKQEDISNMGEIVCLLEPGRASASRTYYDYSNDAGIYRAKWADGDQIAICFDAAATAGKFTLISGADNTEATFYGPVPDNYTGMTAVYPYQIFKKNTSSGITVSLPSIISHNSRQILSDAMPLFAQGKAGALNFYNLTAVIKISVKGDGLLKSVTISSPDGVSLSGTGNITPDQNGMPILTMDATDNDLTVNAGAIFLSDKVQDIYIPVPATNYQGGLILDFCFEGKSETRILQGPLNFERAMLRAVRPYDINVPFDFDAYTPENNEIWYKSDYEMEIMEESGLDKSLVSHSYSKKNRMGVITTDSPVTKIEGQIFLYPGSVTYIKLPDTVQEISMDGLKGMAFDSFASPADLRIIGTDAFLGCHNLKRLILNEGLESIGLEAFGDCPSLEYVYIPKSVNTIAAYSFRGSTSKLDHWDGECALIDKDRHTLYGNTAYGYVSESCSQIDAIAGCNLTEYTIPDQALFTQNYAFSGLRNLKRLVIHKDFKSFGLEVFKSMQKLEVIECLAPVPPTFDPDENFNAPNLKEIRVPQGNVETYKQAPGWSHFADIINALK